MVFSRTELPFIHPPHFLPFLGERILVLKHIALLIKKKRLVLWFNEKVDLILRHSMYSEDDITAERYQLLTYLCI